MLKIGSPEPQFKLQWQNWVISAKTAKSAEPLCGSATPPEQPISSLSSSAGQWSCMVPKISWDTKLPRQLQTSTDFCCYLAVGRFVWRKQLNFLFQRYPISLEINTTSKSTKYREIVVMDVDMDTGMVPLNPQQLGSARTGAT